MIDDQTLFTVGYGAWATAVRMERLLTALEDNGVTMLIDIRHSPCSSHPKGQGSSTYQPKPWHLQTAGKGIAHEVSAVGISYLWLLDLGNPQKNDKEMSILREQINAPYERSHALGDVWPVQRGLNTLREICFSGESVCLLCACKRYGDCHRKLIAETAVQGFGLSNLKSIKDISS